jgi:hypothetical protein
MRTSSILCPAWVQATGSSAESYHERCESGSVQRRPTGGFPPSRWVAARGDLGRCSLQAAPDLLSCVSVAYGHTER